MRGHLSEGIVEESNIWAEFIYLFVTQDVGIHGGRDRVDEEIHKRTNEVVMVDDP